MQVPIEAAPVEKGGGSAGEAVGRIASILAIPYGYTVSLWSAGALLLTRLGRPSTLEIVLFATGAACAFMGLGGVGRSHLAAEVPMRVPARIVANAFPVLVVLGLAMLPDTLINRGITFFAYSFFATTAYVLCLAWFIRGRVQTKISVAKPGEPIV